MSSYRERTVYEVVTEGDVPRVGFMRYVVEKTYETYEEALEDVKVLEGINVRAFVRAIVLIGQCAQEAA